MSTTYLTPPVTLVSATGHMHFMAQRAHVLMCRPVAEEPAGTQARHCRASGDILEGILVPIQTETELPAFSNGGGYV